MKNIRLFLAIFVFAVSFSGNAQKVKLKKGEVLVDDVVWLKFDGCGTWNQTCSLSNLAGDEIIYMTKEKIYGEAFWKVKFLGTQQTIELALSIDNFNGSLLKKFYVAKVVNTDGTLNEENILRMVEKYGNSFSQTQTVNTTQTIIIKEEPKKSGININIGN